ncbi:alpha/beta fold hydrolase [Streptomyces sp. cf386]|uniref:alpha/beta fold hydrolase n=1 Tax=Streptomyces sp. cf386 TaxID=1761904 RepID=UPI000A4D5714
MVRSLAENARRSFRDEWGQVVCPTLVVPAQSSFIPAREADEMLRQRPDTLALSIPGTGHDLHLEQPGILHAALAEFLQNSPEEERDHSKAARRARLAAS